MEKSKKIDKIKKFLKKKAVRIALSVGALVAVVNAGYQLGKQNTNVKEVETEILDQNENKELIGAALGQCWVSAAESPWRCSRAG